MIGASSEKTSKPSSTVGRSGCRPMGDGLYEVRSDLSGRRTARLLFCIAADRLVLLHGFIKKTRETPDSELKLARDRKRKVEESRQ